MISILFFGMPKFRVQKPAGDEFLDRILQTLSEDDKLSVKRSKYLIL